MATMTLDQVRGGNAPAVPASAPIMPCFGSSDSFDLLMRQARLFNTSTMVPPQFQGPQNAGNCIIAFEMALRMGATPLFVMQNLSIIHGRPAWSASFLVACFNQCGKYSSLRYEFSGEPGKDSYGCRAVATELATGQRLEGTVITLGMARAEGWSNKQGSKWGTMPEQMLRYRAASFFIRAYAPEIAMGLRTADEVRDMVAVDAEVVAPAQVSAPSRKETTVEALQPASEPRQTPATGPTPNGKTARRSRPRPLNGEIREEAPKEAPKPAPTPEAKPRQAQLSDSEEAMAAAEQTFIKMCEKAGILPGEILLTFEEGGGVPDAEQAMGYMVADRGLFDEVAEATRRRLGM